MGREEALKLAHQADEIYSSRGKKTVHLNLKKDRPSDDEIADLLLGPTGNLRAPTFMVGKVLLVGFNEESYASILRKAMSVEVSS